MPSRPAAARSSSKSSPDTGPAQLLIAARLARSIGQGALVVDFSLYLHQLHWTAVQISLILAITLLVGATLTMLVGPLSDRIGRRQFLMWFEAAQALAALLACFSANPWLLGPAAVIGGFGRGGNGSAGPFAPVEQAWLAQGVPADRRGRVYSLNAASGFIGMALGALLAALPARLGAWLPGALAFRPLFAIALLGSLICMALLARAPDSEARAGRRDAVAARQAPAQPIQTAQPQPQPASTDEAALLRRENGLLLRLGLVNAVNGIGVGLTGPLMSYWFAIRYGEGPGLIGPMMALGFLLAGLSSLLAGRLTARLGIVRTVVLMRLAGLVLFVALPFAPSFGIAAALYTLRNLCNRGTAGVRNALSAGLVRPSRRGLAASIANVSLQIPRSIGPVFAGMLFQAGYLGLPFIIGAVFQAGFVYLYHRHFDNVEMHP
ncbi:MFS transporter [Candidimonas humi]|uniref:MFS transporter n=1 Tax=Candidimonas humi TaxID=683355 RepID=A0ABV8NTF6_9BURK|nr:MFS transporter [Candidimonas humi]MBV6305314.1 MFS transporter [Candidimonas humi]